MQSNLAYIWWCVAYNLVWSAKKSEAASWAQVNKIPSTNFINLAKIHSCKAKFDCLWGSTSNGFSFNHIKCLWELLIFHEPINTAVIPVYYVCWTVPFQRVLCAVYSQSSCTLSLLPRCNTTQAHKNIKIVLVLHPPEPDCILSTALVLPMGMLT